MAQRLERSAFERRIARACSDAEALVERLRINEAPVDPVEIAESEQRLLRLCPGHYKDAFDGRLEYLPEGGQFICYYNTKYDRPDQPGHAPRTRFSLAHELGHYFIESHHEYLRAGGRTHSSKSEFVTTTPIEQEADAFAARLLMPDRLFAPLVNQDELSVTIIAELAERFRTSFVSTALRAVESTDFYCAVAAVRSGGIAWMRCGRELIRRQMYPGQRGSLNSKTAAAAWQAFRSGKTPLFDATSWANDWFRIYNDKLDRLPVLESYLAAPVMDTLLVVLTIPEDELWMEED